MYIPYNVMRFNTLFIIFTLDIKQCPRYMSLKNSLVETLSNNFSKLINNSSSLNSVNHKCDGVCISDINRPFAGSGHMVQNKLHWDANEAVGLSKQRKVGLDWYEFLCFESPTASFASQCNLFRTM